MKSGLNRFYLVLLRQVDSAFRLRTGMERPVAGRRTRSVEVLVRREAAGVARERQASKRLKVVCRRDGVSSSSSSPLTLWDDAETENVVGGRVKKSKNRDCQIYAKNYTLEGARFTWYWILEPLDSCHDDWPLPDFVNSEIIQFWLVQIQKTLQLFVPVQNKDWDVILRQQNEQLRLVQTAAILLCPASNAVHCSKNRKISN